jgi:hypothetical protein
MMYRGVKIPRCNGRPQLWLRGSDDHQSIRIIYPSGLVEYCISHPYTMSPDEEEQDTLNDFNNRGACTSRRSQLAAVKAAIRYDRCLGPRLRPIFCGYL